VWWWGCVRGGGGGGAPPPFVVLGVVAQDFVEVDFNKYFARWGFNISESSDF